MTRWQLDGALRGLAVVLSLAWGVEAAGAGGDTRSAFALAVVLAALWSLLDWVATA